jgi:hypothetical protein
VIAELMLASLALADGPSRVLYVFDQSGSMGVPFIGADGKEVTRIDAAKKEVRGSMAGRIARDPGVYLGLMVFGNRTGCAEPEVLVNTSVVGQRSSIDSRLADLEPSGDTPLAMAINRGGKYLLSQGGGELVVVTDGYDGCDGDPEREASLLLRDGVRTSVVAIDPRPGAEGAFAAIARAGGGSFKAERPAGVPSVSAPVPLPAQLDTGTYLSVFPAPSPSSSSAPSSKPSPRPSAPPADDGPIIDPASVPKDVTFGAPPPSPKPIPKPSSKPRPSPSAEPEMGPLPLL